MYNYSRVGMGTARVETARAMATMIEQIIVIIGRLKVVVDQKLIGGRRENVRCRRWRPARLGAPAFIYGKLFFLLPPRS
jgi:hypothetical protein